MQKSKFIINGNQLHIALLRRLLINSKAENTFAMQIRKRDGTISGPFAAKIAIGDLSDGEQNDALLYHAEITNIGFTSFTDHIIKWIWIPLEDITYIKFLDNDKTALLKTLFPK